MPKHNSARHFNTPDLCTLVVTKKKKTLREKSDTLWLSIYIHPRVSFSSRRRIFFCSFFFFLRRPNATHTQMRMSLYRVLLELCWKKDSLCHFAILLLLLEERINKRLCFTLSLCVYYHYYYYPTRIFQYTLRHSAH